jgi:asparagine synthase (glutamine-hydrolysing)
MIADVPLGLFLSGGIDSAAIAAVATEGGGADVRTINIGFDQPEYDESEQAAAVAADLGTSHQTIRLSGQDILDDVDAVLAAVDQPTVDGVNTYFVSRAARRAGLTVALSGLGGDELFGGYASFRDVPRAMRWHRRLRMIGPGRRVLSAALAMSGRRGWHKAVEMLRRTGTLAQLYLLRRELFLPEERRSLQSLPAGCDPSCGLTLGALDEFAAHTSADDAINSLSRFELTSYMRHMLLRDGDVFSMAHALEVRFPLLDHILVEHAMNLPGAWKRPDPRPKPMLIDAAGSRFPTRVSMLPKRGFTVPWPAWLRGPLRAWAREAISDADVWKSLGFDGAAPLRLWDRFAGGDERIAGLQILALVVLANFTRRHHLRAA